MTPPTALQNSGKAPRRWSHLEWHLKEGGRVLGATAPDPLLGSFMQVSPCPGWERELRTPTPLRWIPVGRGTVRGLGSGLRNRGSPRESPAQLGAGRRQRLLVLRMPAPSQTYLQPHSGDTYTHRATQSLPGWSWGGCPTIGTASPKLNQPLPHREGHSLHLIPTKSASYGPTA